MSTKNTRKQSKFLKYMKGPIKILARARDFYVQSLSGCAGYVTYGGAMGCPTLHPASLPRSFSASSSYSNHSSRDEDMRELIRIASIRGLTGKAEAELLRSEKSPKSPPDLGGGGAAAVTRCRTVAIRKIDEDKPYEFGGDDVAERPLVYTRSKSYAASRKSRMM
ncbi:hypothetical protein DH2020_012444 [Rehmannia glutinosa]|uniref:Uncharacterized protein n=1 Tax=Rehmannia glutinosa TaxID=99300 RepID=A0ABR0X385_REHGL